MLIWIYCFLMCAPPWFWGWSSYIPEGLLVTCSWDYTTRSLSNRLYYVMLLFFGFILPVGVLIFCYATILRFIVQHRNEMNQLMSAATSSRRHKQQTDVRTASIILMLALLYCIAWTPCPLPSLRQLLRTRRIHWWRHNGKRIGWWKWQWHWRHWWQ